MRKPNCTTAPFDKPQSRSPSSCYPIVVREPENRPLFILWGIAEKPHFSQKAREMEHPAKWHHMWNVSRKEKKGTGTTVLAMSARSKARVPRSFHSTPALPTGGKV